jgi:hypothetical protein
MPTTPALRLAAFAVLLPAKPAVPLRTGPAGATAAVMFGSVLPPDPVSHAPNRLPNRLAVDAGVASGRLGFCVVEPELDVTVLSGVQSIQADPAGSRHRVWLSAR